MGFVAGNIAFIIFEELGEKNLIAPTHACMPRSGLPYVYLPHAPGPPGPPWHRAGTLVAPAETPQAAAEVAHAAAARGPCGGRAPPELPVVRDRGWILLRLQLVVVVVVSHFRFFFFFFDIVVSEGVVVFIIL